MKWCWQAGKSTAWPGVRALSAPGRGGAGLGVTVSRAAFGTAKHLSFRGFPKLQPAVQYLRDQGATILGIEIGEGARRVQEHPFAPVTAFVMGNEVGWAVPSVAPRGVSQAGRDCARGKVVLAAGEWGATAGR